jgi:hypothetical protein
LFLTSNVSRQVFRLFILNDVAHYEPSIVLKATLAVNLLLSGEDPDPSLSLSLSLPHKP